MNRTSTFRELFWDNPMTLEATRTVRRFLRAGTSDDNPTMGRRLNIGLLCLLGGLYIYTLLLIARTNEDLSQFLLSFELGLLTLVVPGSLFGAVAIEREKQTYDALIMTRLTPAQIICGKLWWRIGMIAGVMGIFIAPLLLSHFCSNNRNPEYTFGGLIWTQVQIFLWSLCVGAFSLWVSAKSKKGITALLMIVGVLLVFLIGVPTLGALFAVSTYISNNYGSTISNLPFSYLIAFLTCMNPFYGIYTAGSHITHHDDIYSFWVAFGMSVMGLVVYAVCAFGFLIGAIKTLRGLELPMTDNRKRGR